MLLQRQHKLTQPWGLLRTSFFLPSLTRALSGVFLGFLPSEYKMSCWSKERVPQNAFVFIELQHIRKAARFLQKAPLFECVSYRLKWSTPKAHRPEVHIMRTHVRVSRSGPWGHIVIWLFRCFTLSLQITDAQPVARLRTPRAAK